MLDSFLIFREFITQETGYSIKPIHDCPGVINEGTSLSIKEAEDLCCGE